LEDDERYDRLQKTLFTWSFPKKIVPVIQGQIESEIRSGQIPEVTSEDIPKSATWLNNMWSRLKREGH
jgi:hypothetical protein